MNRIEKAFIFFTGTKFPNIKFLSHMPLDIIGKGEGGAINEIHAANKMDDFKTKMLNSEKKSIYQFTTKQDSFTPF